MIKFLMPFDVCNYCTLIEAVEWIAYRAYPMAHDEDNHERFYEPSTLDAVYEDPENEISDLDKEFELIHHGDDSDEEKIKELFGRRKQEQDDAEESYQSEISDAKHELFLALRKGELTAYGVFFDKMKDGYSPSQWRDKKAWNSVGDDDDDDESSFSNVRDVHDFYSEDMFLNEKKVQKIPKSHWKFEGISWQTGKALSTDGRYIFIHFDFNELIKVFEEDVPELFTVEKRGKYLFYKDEDGQNLARKFSPNKLGRKVVVDWDMVHARIALKIRQSEDGKLPKQDSFAQEIKDWIANELKQDVGLSTVKAKLKPYYAIFQK